MKYVLTIILCLLASSESFAQKEHPLSKVIFQQFMDLYNESQYREIFELFSPEMKEALPKHSTVDFLSGLMESSGKIVSQEFMRYQSTYALYKSNFEKGIIQMAISVDSDTMINGLFAKPYEPEAIPLMVRNASEMILPFHGEWTVFWGGDTKELNYHIQSRYQKNAFDWVIMDPEGKTYKNEGLKNEDYYAFGKKIIAPCNAEVVLAVDGVKENKPGEMNPAFVPGNTVILKTENDEYLFFAHFKQNTIQVKEGDTVKTGQLLGLCGNTGNSSEAHLHFHIMDRENINEAIGVKCYFHRIEVNGEIKTDHSPIKNEKINNPDL